MLALALYLSCAWGVESNETWSSQDQAILNFQVRLPKNATRNQTRQYITANCERALTHRNDASSVFIAKIAQINPEHLDVLLDFSCESGVFNWEIAEVCRTLATEKYKELIIDKLLTNPNLITVITSKGWTADAKENMIKLLRAMSEKEDSLPDEYLECFVNWKDPMTYDYLRNYYQGCPLERKCATFRILQQIDGLDLSSVADGDWKLSKEDEAIRPWVAVQAAFYGNFDALDWLFGQIKAPGVRIDSVSQNSVNLIEIGCDNNLESLRRFIDIKVKTADGIVKWYEVNKSKLKYDSKKHKYLTEPQK